MAELQTRILPGSTVEVPSSEEDEDDLYHIRHLQQATGDLLHMESTADRVQGEEEFIVEGIVIHELRRANGLW